MRTASEEMTKKLVLKLILVARQSTTHGAKPEPSASGQLQSRKMNSTIHYFIQLLDWTENEGTYETAILKFITRTC
jgi:hypothetical protein